MSRLLCLTELLRRLARPERAASPAARRSAGSDHSLQVRLAPLAQVPLTWGFGVAGRRYRIIMRLSRGRVSGPLMPEICMSEVMSFFVL